MLRRLINHISPSLTAAAAILALASLASRALGLIRDRLLTHTFGAGPTLDAYYAAFRLPDLVYSFIIVGALSAAFIPLFSHWWAERPQRAWRFCHVTFTVFFVALTVAGAIGVLMAPLITRIVAPGFDESTAALATQLTRIMMISPVLLGLSALVGGVLQSLKKFLWYACAPVVYNIGIIFGVVAFVPSMGPIGLAWGVVIGALFHLLIQVPSLLASGFRPKILWAPRDSDVRALVKLMAPRTVALAASQISATILLMIASGLSAGSVAVFTLAMNIQSLPIGVIAVSYAVAAFPLFAHYAAEENPDALARTVGESLRMIMVWLLPVSVLFVVLRAEWVRILFGSGKFDWSDTVLTANTLGFFALGLVAQALVHVLARAFYALRDSRTPALVALCSVSITVIFALVAAPYLGVYALALAVGIEGTINSTALYILLRKRLGTLDDELTLRLLYKICAAALALGVTTQLLKEPVASFVDMQTFFGVFVKAVSAAGGGLVVYISVGLLLGVEEIFVIVTAARVRVRRVAQLLPIDWGDVGSVK